jgi:hypothetical protein
MQLVIVSEDMKDNAKMKAAEMGTLNNSILKGEGNLIGFIGEELAQKVIGGRIQNSYDYDIILASGKTVDVKTKKTTVIPKDNYDCSVASYNTKQKCDYYCFVRVKDDLSCGWVLGVYDKKDYFKDAVFLKKGQIDPSNNFTVKADCYNIKINQLKKEIE